MTNAKKKKLILRRKPISVYRMLDFGKYEPITISGIMYELKPITSAAANGEISTLSEHFFLQSRPRTKSRTATAEPTIITIVAIDFLSSSVR